MCISVVALLISLVSLALSAYAVFRDRHKLEASAEYLESFANITDRVLIRVANVGRRPSSPRQLLIATSSGQKLVHALREAGKPIVLSESAYYEIVLDPEHISLSEMPLENTNRCVVIDSRGKEYPVKDGPSILNKHADTIKGAI